MHAMLFAGPHATPKSLSCRVVPMAGALLLLTSCASTKVEHLVLTSAPASPAPAILHIAVLLAPDIDADPAAVRASRLLQQTLVERYIKAGLAASVTGEDATAPGSATVRVTISRADAGSEAKRLLIGFGAGRTLLKAETVFQIAGQSAPAMRFASSSKGGRKPGLILPGGIGATTGEITRIAIGAGVAALAETREGLRNEVDRTAKLIFRQTRALYRTAEWHWPLEDSSVQSSM